MTLMMFIAAIIGVSTILNSKKIYKCRKSFFIRETLNDLKFNKEGLTCVQTRSRTEAKFIELFERNKILWSFETLHLIKKDSSGIYTPDFIVYLPEKIYIVECKGGWFNQDKDYYLKNCISVLIDYARENKMIPCLTFIQNPKTLDFLEKDRLC